MTAQQERFRLLFVDDVPANIRILVEMLRLEYDVIFTDNGPEALKLAAENPQPDLILLDIMMPRMDGYEVCRKLKENEATRVIPVMFITALVDEDDEAMGLSIGAVDYIRKPFNMAIVKSRIKTHLDLKHHRDELLKKTEELTALNAQLAKEIQERKKTEAMVQEHLGYLQQLIKDNAFPSSPRNRSSDENKSG
ncbi:MAG: response regulator [Proteobacteria bacterium]|nr:response regulator [Pseudomonadota bacterium]MBU4297113.1 response regulator [Pseudomonadota bacterium]MCG2746535.1 response regulator [Desulfobulbaceae bacterium]